MEVDGTDGLVFGMEIDLEQASLHTLRGVELRALCLCSCMCVSGMDGACLLALSCLLHSTDAAV